MILFVGSATDGSSGGERDEALIGQPRTPARPNAVPSCVNPYFELYDFFFVTWD